MQNHEILAEIDRLKTEFKNADENKLRMLEALIEQAAFERIQLRRLNEIAMVSGLVKVHPNNPKEQKKLQVSAEIIKHNASLTNIMEKLMKYLYEPDDDDDDGLEDYE